MSEEKKAPLVEFKELDEWGEGFGLIMSPEPLACPRCGSTDFRRLIYGLPAEPLSEREQEYFVLGGCVVREGDWRCMDCGLEW